MAAIDHDQGLRRERLIGAFDRHDRRHHVLYVTHGGYIGDGGDYQGHVTTINLATGAQVVFNTLAAIADARDLDNGDCATRQSGIWGAAARRTTPAPTASTSRPATASTTRAPAATTGATRRSRSQPTAPVPAAACRATATRRRTSSSSTIRHRSRLDLARDHAAARGQHGAASRHADRQGRQTAPDQSRRHERPGRPRARRRRACSLSMCRKAAAACASSRRHGSIGGGATWLFVANGSGCRA